MSDKVKGALFNTLGDITGLTVFDPFAGTGALSFEAISRGAASAVAVDVDKKAFKILLKNVEALDIHDNVKVQRKNASSWSDSHKGTTFDLLLADPPYDDINPKLLSKLVRHLKTGGLFVMSWPGNEQPRQFEGLTMLGRNNYGDASLVFYRKVS